MISDRISHDTNNEQINFLSKVIVFFRIANFNGFEDSIRKTIEIYIDKDINGIIKTLI